MIYLL